MRQLSGHRHLSRRQWRHRHMAPNTKKNDRFRQPTAPTADPVTAAFSYVNQASNVQTTVLEQAPQSSSEQVILPPWLQHFELIPIDRIRPGRYQTRRPEAVDTETYEQLESQMRMS